MHRRNGKWLIRDYAPSGSGGIGCLRHFESSAQGTCGFRARSRRASEDNRPDRPKPSGVIADHWRMLMSLRRATAFSGRRLDDHLLQQHDAEVHADHPPLPESRLTHKEDRDRG